MNIRVADFEDAQSIAQIHVQGWQCAYRGQIPQDYLDSLSTEKRLKFWKNLLSDLETKSVTLVAEKEGKVIGFCCVGPGRDEDAGSSGELTAIYIHPNHLGQGAGTALMKQSLKVLREKGFTKATLWVLGTNQKTRDFYEKNGWKIDGKTKIEEKNGIKLSEVRYFIKLN